MADGAGRQSVAEWIDGMHCCVDSIADGHGWCFSVGVVSVGCGRWLWMRGWGGLLDSGEVEGLPQDARGCKWQRARKLYYEKSQYIIPVSMTILKNLKREGHGRLAHWPLKITGGPVRREDSGTMAIGIAEPGGDGAG